MASPLQTHKVTDDEAGLRLDRWFKRRFPLLGHGQLQKLLRSGQIRVEGKRAEAADRLEPGQMIRVPPMVVASPEEQSKKQAGRDSARLKEMILFQDDDVIALNKPPGLAVQGGTGLKENLDDMLESLRQQGQSKPKLVHRLDRDTSGVLLIARNAFAAAALAEAFRQRSTRKIYWAVTLNVPKPAKGQITAPLLKRGELMEVAEHKDDIAEAKSANTIYQVVESAKKQAAFVALWPVTGRTHQLRVHMAYIGAPLLGDRMYGGDQDPARDDQAKRKDAKQANTPDSAALPFDEFGKGLHLHARRLIIPHPRRGTIDIVAPLPDEMRKTWDWFGFDANADVDFDEG